MSKNRSQSVLSFSKKNIERRAFLKKSARGLAALGITFGGLQSAHAMQKAAQSDVAYQDTPKDGLKCADCSFYDGEGGCNIVEGEISPDGWCAVWSEA